MPAAGRTPLTLLLLLLAAPRSASALTSSYAETRVRDFDSAAGDGVGGEHGLSLDAHWRNSLGSEERASGSRRWVSPDPLFLGDPSAGLERPIELGLYGYASNNPVGNTDPDGLWPREVAAEMAVRSQMDAAERSAYNAAERAAAPAQLGALGLGLAAQALPPAVAIGVPMLAAMQGHQDADLTEVVIVGLSAAVGKLVSLVRGASRAEATAYRYVSEGEAKVIGQTGCVPNVNKAGAPKSVYLSTDKYATVGEAEDALRIGAKDPRGIQPSPTHRVGVDASKAKLDYGGNVDGGTGTELKTRDSVPSVSIERLKN